MKTFIMFFLICSHIVFSQQELVHDVYFDTDKFEIIPTEENRLFLFISNLTNLEINTISIYGFCDDRGTDNYNLKLSQQRADAIKTVFSNNEISELLITNVDGKGEVLLKLIKENDINKIRGLNRKVEIIVTTKPVVLNKIVAKGEKRTPTHEVLKGDLKAGDKIILEKIFFRNGYSVLDKEPKKVLERIAKVLDNRKDIYFTIQGHVCCTKNSRDAVDRRTKKRTLSENRAKAVYLYFAKKGISEKRMKFVGMRRLFPLGGDPKFDRRVEILITYVGESN